METRQFAGTIPIEGDQPPTPTPSGLEPPPAQPATRWVKYFSDSLGRNEVFTVQSENDLTPDQAADFADAHEAAISAAAQPAYRQANLGRVGGALGAPVDMANMALGTASNVYQTGLEPSADPNQPNVIGPLTRNPVGGSEQMRYLGNQAQGYLGEGIRSIGQSVIDTYKQGVYVPPQWDPKNFDSLANPPPAVTFGQRFVGAVVDNLAAVGVNGALAPKVLAMAESAGYTGQTARQMVAGIQQTINNLTVFSPSQLGMLRQLGRAMGAAGLEIVQPAAAQAYAEQAMPGNPMASMWGNLVGSFGVTGALRLVDEAAGRVIVRLTGNPSEMYAQQLQTNTGMVDPYWSNLGRAQGIEQTVNAAANQSGGPTLNFTMGQATGEKGFQAMEQNLTREAPINAQAQLRAADNNQALQHYLETQQGPEDLKAAAQKVREGVDTWRAQLQGAQTQLDQPAQQFGREARQLPSHGESFDNVQRGLQELDDFRRAEELRTYQGLDRFIIDPRTGRYTAVDMTPFIESIAERTGPQMLANANAARTQMQLPALATTSRISPALGPNLTPGEFADILRLNGSAMNWNDVREVRKTLLNAVGNYEASGQTILAGKTRDAIDQLDQFINNQTAPNQIPIVMQFRAANLKTQMMREALVDTYKSKASGAPIGVGDLIKGDRYNFSMGSQTMAERLLSSRQQAQAFNEALGRMDSMFGQSATVARIRDDFNAGVKRFAYERVIDPNTGLVDPAQMRVFQKRFRDGLNEFPQVRDEINALSRSGEAAAEFRNLSAEEMKRFETSAANLMIGEDPQLAIDRIMRADQPQIELRRIVDMASQSPTAIRGLRRGMMDWIRTNSLGGTDIMNGPLYDGAKMKALLNEWEPVLRKSGLYDAEHFSAMKRVAEGFEIMQRSLPAEKVVFNGANRDWLFTQGQIGSRIYGIQRGWYKSRWLASEIFSRMILRRLDKVTDDELVKLASAAMFDKDAAQAYLVLGSRKPDAVISSAFKKILPGFAARLAMRDIPSAISTNYRPPAPAPTPPPPR